MSFTKRLATEYKELRKEGARSLPQGLAYLEPQEDNILNWRAVLVGPDNSPYSGGMFELDIRVPVEYPTKPPSVRSVTTICHPNIHLLTGEICLDILKAEWSPVWTLKSVCTAIVSLLGEPEPNSPLNCDAANLLKSGDVTAYNSLVSMYTKVYSIKQI